MTSDAGRSLDEQLAEFRATYRVVERRHGPLAWRYHRGGGGDETILWLTGVLGAGEFAFPRALALGRMWRMLLPDYPPARSLDELTDGLVALLDAEGVERAHVLGGSFGGMLAQHLVRRHPRRVRSLVLSHTAAPHTSPMASPVLGALRLLPGGVLRALFRRRLRPTDLGDAFWVRYFDECIAALERPDFLSRVALGVEFARGRYATTDLDQWDGRILILESDDDPLMSPANRRALRELYPTARVHTFSGTGHAAAILQPGAYVDIVGEFLRVVSA